MKYRILSLVLALILILPALVSCGSSGSGEVLNLYTWAGMFPDDVLADFEAETGIRINYVNYDYGETMLSKLQAEEGGTYDLIIADDYIIETVIAEGLAQKLDKSKIPSHTNVNPLYQGQFFDPTDEYTIPYGAGVQTIVYNPAKIDIEINGYADLWDASLADRVGIISNYRVINGMALKVMGESYNTTDVDTIKAAGEHLTALAPNIRLIKDDNTQDDLLSGEIDAAVIYTSQVTMAKMTDPSLEVVFPEEGIGFGIMGMFIPSKAPNADAAHKFIEFILDPERGAKCYEWLGYYCTSSASEPYISEEYRDFLTLPAEFTAEDMEMIGNITPDADQAHLDAWTAFREACE
ncbi:MAG: spermidine/putrescine ABC transporter substrate-binding protein [Clostridia bacterium]|nr:spermidine/putrescine ABC transporter substrate-binding protein [Clostridia bacterium]MBQ8333666.1 spermidine/putrescine ABC transporter substrate-binding protein [Clostridia bacterium]